MEKSNPGILKQIKDITIYDELTYEKVNEILKDLKSFFVLYGGCKTNGIVKRTSLDLKLCNDVECRGCCEII